MGPCFFTALALIGACSNTSSPGDSGSNGNDAFVATDSGNGGTDAFVDHDTGGGDVDAFVATDTGAGDVDAFVATDGGPADSGTSGSDGGCAVIDGQLSAHQACGRPTDDPCPTGFTCQAMGGIVAHSECILVCSGVGGSCPCSSACVEHPALQGAPAYNSCDEL